MDIIEIWVQRAHNAHASDLHLEANVSPAFRVRGSLIIQEGVCPSRKLVHSIRSRLSEEQWRDFHDKKSLDVSMFIARVRCRVNVFQTAKGVALSIRLFRSAAPTIKSLNLHPTIKDLVDHDFGLVLICGATGSGKSSTLAALIQEINRTRTSQIITLENPIEYMIRSNKSLIRQREVGRDTPSFGKGLNDALRQDPDVILVGEMRTSETMIRTIEAAETGHLVFSTLHASSCVEAIQRLVSSVPDSSRNSVQAQLADCLVAVVCQRLVYLPKAKQRIPECSIVRGNHAVKNCIRTGQIHRLHSIMETGRSDHMFTLDRYREWIKEQNAFSKPLEVEDIQEQNRAQINPPQRRNKENRITTDGILDLDGVEEDPASILARYRKKH
ncbi:MAG: twitching motility protein PilT [Deltaproteobacteria bacterium]|nr:twitching motility protein PilT [Deltaproteobacteria bacterium]